MCFRAYMRDANPKPIIPVPNSDERRRAPVSGAFPPTLPSGNLINDSEGGIPEARAARQSVALMKLLVHQWPPPGAPGLWALMKLDRRRLP